MPITTKQAVVPVKTACFQHKDQFLYMVSLLLILLFLTLNVCRRILRDGRQSHRDCHRNHPAGYRIRLGGRRRDRASCSFLPLCLRSCLFLCRLSVTHLNFAKHIYLLRHNLHHLLHQFFFLTLCNYIFIYAPLLLKFLLW